MKINNYLEHNILWGWRSVQSCISSRNVCTGLTISTWLLPWSLGSVFTGCVSLFPFLFFCGRNCSFYWRRAIWKCRCWIVTGAALFESSRLAANSWSGVCVCVCRKRAHTSLFRMECCFMWPLADWRFSCSNILQRQQSSHWLSWTTPGREQRTRRWRAASRNRRFYELFWWLLILETLPLKRFSLMFPCLRSLLSTTSPMRLSRSSLIYRVCVLRAWSALLSSFASVQKASTYAALKTVCVSCTRLIPQRCVCVFVSYHFQYPQIIHNWIKQTLEGEMCGGGDGTSLFPLLFRKL